MKYCFKSIHLLISRHPLFLLEEIITCILSIITSIIPIYLVKNIILYYEQGKDLSYIVLYILILFALIAFLNFIIYALSIYKSNIERLFIANTSKEFYIKLQHIDYDFHENPMFLNDYTRSLEEGVNNIYNAADSAFYVMRILIQSTSILNVFTIIANENYIIICAAICVAILYMLIYIRIGILQKAKNKKQRPFQRVSWYSNRAFSIKDAMADIKTSNIDELLIENNEKSLDKCVEIIDKYSPRITFWSTIAQWCLIILYPVIIGCLAYFAIVQGTVDISSFASLTVAASSISSLISNLASAIGEVESILPDLQVPFDLLKMKGLIEGSNGEKINEDFESLDIDNVSFSYDNKKNQLENINIHINKGDHIAIVGANGAGKTTLVKLLLRLYDPTVGTIKFNFKDYKDLNVKDLRKQVGAVFQNVETYAVSIAENILLRTPKTKADYDLINDALKFSDLYDYVYSLPENINTEMNREFHKKGTIFSKGQSQRLAIARGYAQNYQLFILDEPSSALDPIAEAKVYKNMLNLGKDKTIIFISHRLTTTVNATKIYLFDNGKIIESGTHEELMALNGLYHKMFVSQSKKYIGVDYE